MVILIDQDGPLADFDGELERSVQNLYPDIPVIKQEDRSNYSLSDHYPENLRSKITDIYIRPGFIVNLPLVVGAKEALDEMHSEGHDVFICTAPLTNYQNNILEKYQWVEEKLGIRWVRKMVLTKDKTLVRGDYLIDDKPEIIGLFSPNWEHIVFDKPYNKNIDKPRLFQWKDWHNLIK